LPLAALDLLREAATGGAGALTFAGDLDEEERDGDCEELSDAAAFAEVSAASGTAGAGAGAGGVKGLKPQSRTRQRCSTPLGRQCTTSLWVNVMVPPAPVARS